MQITVIANKFLYAISESCARLVRASPGGGREKKNAKATPSLWGERRTRNRRWPKELADLENSKSESDLSQVDKREIRNSSLFLWSFSRYVFYELLFALITNLVTRECANG